MAAFHTNNSASLRSNRYMYQCQSANVLVHVRTGGLTEGSESMEKLRLQLHVRTMLFFIARHTHAFRRLFASRHRCNTKLLEMCDIRRKRPSHRHRPRHSTSGPHRAPSPAHPAKHSRRCAKAQKALPSIRHQPAHPAATSRSNPAAARPNSSRHDQPAALMTNLCK